MRAPPPPAAQEPEDTATLRSFHQRLASLALEHTLTLNALDEGVLRVDPLGRVAYANPAAAALLGATTDGLVGQTFPQAVAHAHEAGPCAVCAALAAGTPARAELEIGAGGDAQLPVECAVAPLRAGGHPGGAGPGDPAAGAAQAGAVVVLRDLRDRRRADAARAAAARRAAEVDRLNELLELKVRFLNLAAHELNTPLTPILLQVHQLRARHAGAAAASAQDRASWEILDRNLQRLAGLVRDVVEAARVQSGVHIATGPVDLGAAVREAAQHHADEAGLRGVAIAAEAPVGLWAAGDPSALALVLHHLVGNALKFTARGGHVEVRAAGDGAAVRVEVRDDGRGLLEQDAEALFQPFVHGAGPGDVPAGAGLGLYICKGIVEALGGAIGCASEGPGRGSTFWFTLPAAEQPPGPGRHRGRRAA